MKLTIYFFSLFVQIIFFISCNNSAKSDSSTKKNIIIDNVENNDNPVNKNETFIKKSNPFKINGIECYWEQSDTLTDEGRMDLIKLKDYKTKRILVNHVECCLKYGFDFNSPNNFMDVNFDGFKDFLIVSYGSMAMFELTNIYLFDSKTKQFEYSNLSDNGIEIDGVNRRLITSSTDKSPNGRNFEKTKTHYFDKFGKVKYTEVITEEDWDTIPIVYRTYEKIVNGKIVETKKDSVINTEK